MSVCVCVYSLIYFSILLPFCIGLAVSIYIVFTVQLCPAVCSRWNDIILFIIIFF